MESENELVLDCYIGTKIIHATKMSEFDFNTLKNRSLPENQKDRPGYFVRYPDGYESWSPKGVFESAYMRTDDCNMNCGLAIEALRKGLAVRRKAWPEKMYFIFLLEAGMVPLSIVHDEALANVMSNHELTEIHAEPSLRLVTNEDGMMSLRTGYTMTTQDLLATDWYLV